MAITYNSLVSDVLSYLERYDTAIINIMPTLIMLAQRRVDNDMKTLGQAAYVTGNFDPPFSIPSNGVIAKPDGWRNTLSFAIGTGINNEIWLQLELRSYDWCRNYWPNSTAVGTPAYYCDFGFNNILIVPTPDSEYPFQFSYMQEFPPINTENQTNWLTVNAPEVVFFATLLEAMIFLKNDGRLPLIQAQYQHAMDALDSTDRERLTDRFTTRDKD